MFVVTNASGHLLAGRSAGRSAFVPQWVEMPTGGLDATLIPVYASRRAAERKLAALSLEQRAGCLALEVTLTALKA